MSTTIKTYKFCGSPATRDVVAFATGEAMSVCNAHAPCSVCGQQFPESTQLCEEHRKGK